MTKLRYQSLHTHTTDSDGLASHLQVLEAAERNGFGTIAFTDHDILLSARRLNELHKYRGPVRWISGVELSCGLPKELGGGAVDGLHIVGLFVNPSNPSLVEHCRKFREARNRRMKAIVSQLKDVGFTISERDCLEASGGDNVARPHIVQALSKHPENMPVIKKIETEMACAAKEDPRVSKFHEEYKALIEERPDQQPYKLFLDAQSYIPIDVTYDYWQDFDTCVQLIREASGVAVWAHWWTIAKKVDAALLERIVAEGRVDALETNFPLSPKTLNKNEAVLQDIAKRYELPQITAMDLHRLSDFELFTAQPYAAAGTELTLESIAKHTGHPLNGSN